MILDYILHGDISSVIIGLCVSAFVVFCILPIHEFAHAFVADKLGDDTPRMQGRLTLYPLSHIDFFGAIMILLVGFGYAKPVPVNPMRTKMKNKKAAMAIIAIAGPVSNLLIALISTFIFTFIRSKFGLIDIWSFALYTFFEFCAYININLAVFNLIPIPPLDGSRLLTAFLPSKAYFKLLQYERYITLVVLFLLIIGVLSKPLGYISGVVLKGFMSLAGLIF